MTADLFDSDGWRGSRCARPGLSGTRLSRRSEATNASRLALPLYMSPVWAGSGVFFSELRILLALPRIIRLILLSYDPFGRSDGPALRCEQCLSGLAVAVPQQGCRALSRQR